MSELSAARDRLLEALRDPPAHGREPSYRLRDPSRLDLTMAYGLGGIAHVVASCGADLNRQVSYWLLSQHVTPDQLPPGLYGGACGVAWCLSSIGTVDMGERVLGQFLNHELRRRSADLYYGESGMGLSLLRFWSRTRKQSYLDAAVEIGDWLIATRQSTMRGCWWHSDGDLYVGLARGAAGVALFLLYLWAATGDGRYLDTGEAGLWHDLTYGIKYEAGHVEFPEAPPRGRALVISPYWWSGSAGIASVLLRYVLFVREPYFVETLARVLRSLNIKYASWPGLFRGLTGVGEALLDCHWLTGQESARAAAAQLADGLLLYIVDEGGRAGLLGDRLERPCDDVGTGSAGALMFLDRLLHPGPSRLLLPDELLLDAGAPVATALAHIEQPFMQEAEIDHSNRALGLE